MEKEDQRRGGEAREAPSPLLGGKVILYAGDCLEILKGLDASSIDSVVTDPPYHLTSIVQRFGNLDSAPAKYGSDGRFARASAGFMGKKWDGGDIAFQPELWLEVLRVLKPGGHLISFGGTRTYHRMACAIEDAGFEVRDCIAWLYGSGFPKSHDISKAIDKNHHAHEIAWFGEWLRQERKKRGISQKQLAETGGFFDNVNHGGLVANWELGYGLPSAKEFNKVCDILGVDFERIEELEREVIGKRKVNAGVAFTSEGPTELDITAPATDAARQWAGFGTALKPAMEPVVVARKPLGEKTIAANVLKHGTGALNIDGCRVELVGDSDPRLGGKGTWSTDKMAKNVYKGGYTGIRTGSSPLGRWPANVIHDGSDEVLARFPESDGQQGDIRGTEPSHTGGKDANCYGEYGRVPFAKRGDLGGSAARFFYSAKADKGDRLGSKHPTVKPLDLMQYLVRLVTPPGGVVLDPFAGTGTTGEAAWREGMRAVLIERELEYLEDIRRRMKLAASGPEERARESIKAAGRAEHPGPLFDLLR